MRKSISGILISVLFMMVSASHAAQQKHVAMEAGCGMIMDGIPDEPAWKKATPVGPYF